MQSPAQSTGHAPHLPSVDGELGLAWQVHQAGRVEEAARLYRFILEKSPGDPQAWCFLAMAYHDMRRFDEALDAYARALKLEPAFPIALNNSANTLRSMGRLSESISRFRAVLAMDPGYVTSRFNLSLTLLQQGNWLEGFAAYESRWQFTGRKEPVLQRPRWDGSPLSGRRILLHAEQGLGDTLQFVRFAQIAKSRGGIVSLIADPKLAPVLAGCKSIDEIFVPGAAKPRYHVHAPLMSLPHILGLQVTDLPSAPYMTADPGRVAAWRQELMGHPGLKIGLSWQGSPSNAFSAPLAMFSQLARTQGVQFISLQRGVGTEQISAQQEQMNILDFGERLDADGAFVDTAAIMANLDLVVTVDTATAHLAGALGVPVWLALDYAPDWRWMLGRSDSPWYPSARLFRQPKPGDWNSVFRDMAAALSPARRR